MSETLHTVLLAVALIFVLEGLFYAIFPHIVRKMMLSALQNDPDKLRSFGLGMAILGAILVWIVQQLH